MTTHNHWQGAKGRKNYLIPSEDERGQFLYSDESRDIKQKINFWEQTVTMMSTYSHDDNMQETTAGSPKTTHDSPSSTPGIPSPVYRDMHLVKMTSVADDHHRESSAEPAREDVLAEQYFPHDEQLSNLFRAMLLQTTSLSGPRSYTRALMQPRVYQASSPVDTSLAQPGRQEHLEPSGKLSHDAHLAEVRLRHVGARRQPVYKQESEF